MKQYARITGWGKSVPDRVLTNHDLEQMVDTSDEWITTRTGIKKRHIAGPNDTSATMSLDACRKALAMAEMEPSQVDLIIIATSTPDYFCPPVSSIVQDQLGAPRAAAFLLIAGCTGFVYGLVTASQFIENGLYNNALIVGVETLSAAVNWEDRNTCVLFGDGGAAVLLEASDQPTGIISAELGSDGSDWDALIVPGIGCANPLSEEAVRNGQHYIHMDGKRIFRFATRKLGEAVTNVVRESGLPWDDIDLIIPHQANARIIELAVRRLGIPPEKMYVNIERYGNTSAASIPLALCDALDEGRIHPGDHIVLVGFGAGLTWAATLLHWEPEPSEETPILVEDWPLPDWIPLPSITEARNAFWNLQVSARSHLQDATMMAMTPVHRLRKRLKRD